MNSELEKRLSSFNASLCLDDENELLAVLRSTRIARERGLPLDFDQIRRELWGYIPHEPFTLIFDASKSLRYIVDNLLVQAAKRQKESTGTMYAGAILQHLVGAKLAIILGDAAIKHHGFSVADSSSERRADFGIEDVAIHVTTTPSESLMEKCLDNLNSGLRPVIITTQKSLTGAQSLAEIKGVGQSVDIVEAGQFIATNVYEWSKFKAAGRKLTVEKLVTKYNEIVGVKETDPGLRIALGR